MEKNNFIKFKNDFFMSDKVAIIEKLANSDTLIVIWFKLLTLSSRSNSRGKLLIGGQIPYTTEMLCETLKKDKNTIDFALKMFEEFGMIENVDGVIRIKEWKKYLCDDYGDKVREQNKIRQEKYRERKKLKMIMELSK